jgi:ribosomal protein L11 methyltransferase
VPRQVHALAIHFPPLAPHSDLPDLVAAALDEPGLAAVHETGADNQPCWHVFLSDPSQLASIAAELSARFAPEGCHVEIVEIEDEDWAARTQAHLRHVTIDRLVVAPPWDVPSPMPSDTHLIVIPPSMGFGTGHHETTRLCLQLLQQLDLRRKRLLDVGTGSGVLAIAGLLLGAVNVEGIDCDEDALASARQGVAVNGLTGRIRFRTGDVRVDQTAAADVVTANLTGGLLTAAAPALAGLVPEGGACILSGFQRHETPAILESFVPYARLQRQASEGDWDAVLLLRTPHRQ